MTELLPIGDRLKVLPLTPPAQTSGGLFLPESARDVPSHGLVLAVGRGSVFGGKRTPLEIEAGDVVAFGKYAGVYTVDGDGLEVLLMRESEVLGRKPKKQLAADPTEWVEHEALPGDMAKHLLGDPRCRQCKNEEPTLPLETP